MSKVEPVAGLSQTVESKGGGQTLDDSDVAITNVRAARDPAVARTIPGNSEEPPTVAKPLSRIGRYLVLRRLGEGGMGVVHAGYDEELDRRVAIKLLHPSQQGDSKLRGRIIREAQALARVSSPHVVHVYEVGEVDEQVFIVMEFINGTTLSKWQSEKHRSWQEILRISRRRSTPRREGTRTMAA